MLKECLTSNRSSKVSTIVVWLISFSQSRSKEHPKPLQLPEVLGENCPSRTPKSSSCTVSFSETRRSSTYTTRIKITSVFFPSSGTYANLPRIGPYRTCLQVRYREAPTTVDQPVSPHRECASVLGPLPQSSGIFMYTSTSGSVLTYACLTSPCCSFQPCWTVTASIALIYDMFETCANVYK